MTVLTLDEQITQKLDKLTIQQKQAVSVLVDELAKANQPNQAEEDLSRLLNVSVWSEDDVREIEHAQQHFNRWTIQEF